nr:hypothetical protein [Candidatus Sigynarchaeota archaeon]
MSGKSCAACKKEILDFNETLYCFSCDSLFCSTCKASLLQKGKSIWTCPNCKDKRDVSEATLFKT